MVVASLIKEFQLASELNHMKGIVPDDILDALKKKKLGLPGIDTEAPEQKNAMMAGEFEVIVELLEKYSKDDQGKIAKAQVYTAHHAEGVRALKKVTDSGYPRACRFRKHQILNRSPEVPIPT
jgi:hypothetical protein